MYHQCNTEKTALQQQLFTDALFHSLQNNPYSEISIISLCNQTGLSRNIFYRLFDCKDDVLCAVIDNYFFKCGQIMNSSNPRENIDAFFAFWKEQKILFDILERNRLNSLLTLRAAICCLRSEFGIQRYIQEEWHSYEEEIIPFYVGGFIELLFNWYYTDFSRPVEEMTNITLQILKQSPLRIE